MRPKDNSADGDGRRIDDYRSKKFFVDERWERRYQIWMDNSYAVR